MFVLVDVVDLPKDIGARVVNKRFRDQSVHEFLVSVAVSAQCHLLVRTMFGPITTQNSTVAPNKTVVTREITRKARNLFLNHVLNYRYQNIFK